MKKLFSYELTWNLDHEGSVCCGEIYETSFIWVLLTCLQSYDYSLEKVKLYTRVPLGEIVSITKGVSHPSS